MAIKANEILNNIDSSISKLNDASVFKAVSNINSVLLLLDRLKNSAAEAASAVASVFEVAASIDVGLNNDLERMQVALANLGAAAYEKFQDPMRNAIQDVTECVNTLTNSIIDGELSESLETIANGMSNIATAAISLVGESVLPAAINSLAWIIDNGQTLIDIVTVAATAVAAYSGVVAAASIANMTLTEGMMLLGVAIGVTKAKIIESLMAIKAAINPTAAIVAAATAAFVAGSLALKHYVDNKDIAAHGDAFVEKTRKETEALKEQKEAFDALKASQEEKLENDLISVRNVERLWEELQTYVDETSGNVNDINGRASKIIDYLNENYDINIEYINGQIQGYDELADSMDNYIEKMRLESRIRSGQDSYDETVKTYDSLLKKREELERQEKLFSGQAKDYHEYGLYDKESEAASRRNEIVLEIEEIDNLIADCKTDMAEYEGLFSEKVALDPPKLTVEVDVDDSASDVLENELTEVEEAIVDVIDTHANDPDLQYSLDNIFSYDTSAAEDTVDDVKDTMQEMWDSISKQERLGLISSEEAYRQQLELIEQYCPEYADEWYDYYQTILDYQRNALREQVQGVRDNISDIVSEYRNAFGELETSVSSYKNKLLSVESIFTVKTETDDEGNETTTYTVENMTKQMEKMQKYHDLVKNLKDRGVSNEVLSELTTLDFDEGMVFAENLALSSDADLERITALYAQRDKLAEDLANELYAPEMDKLNEDLIAGITEQFGTLPEDIRAIGGQSLSAFIEGVLEDKANLSDAAQEFMDSFFSACDEGISSGTVGMKNVGQNIADALGEQDTYSIGLEKGRELAEGFNAALSDLNNKLLAGHAEISAGLIAAGQNSQGSYGSSSWSGSSGKNERIVFENKEEVTVKIDKDVLGRTMREWTKEYERRSGT